MSPSPRPKNKRKRVGKGGKGGGKGVPKRSKKTNLDSSVEEVRIFIYSKQVCLCYKEYVGKMMINTVNITRAV